MDGGDVRPAQVVRNSWMVDTRPAGEDVSFTLRADGSEVCIEGTTVVSSFRPPRPTADGSSFPTLQSGIARYRWGDEEAFGMIERSSRLVPGVALD